MTHSPKCYLEIKEQGIGSLPDGTGIITGIKKTETWVCAPDCPTQTEPITPDNIEWLKAAVITDLPPDAKVILRISNPITAAEAERIKTKVKTFFDDRPVLIITDDIEIGFARETNESATEEPDCSAGIAERGE